MTTRAQKKAFFIAGTDTDVGKTIASTLLLTSLNKQGYHTAAYKPVAAGSEERDGERQNADAIALRSFSSLDLAYHEVNPYPLILPASPHIGAKEEGVTIDYSLLSNGLANLKKQADITLVEGAGGWRVPISEQDYLSTWVIEEQLPVVLVVGIKLGCLNHAILTVETMLHDGANMIGWIANKTTEHVEHYAEMVKMLSDKIPAPKLGEIPYLSEKERRASDIDGIDIKQLQCRL